MVVDIIFDGVKKVCVIVEADQKRALTEKSRQAFQALRARRKPQLHERFGRIEQLYACLHSNYQTGNGSILVSCVGSLSLC